MSTRAVVFVCEGQELRLHKGAGSKNGHKSFTLQAIPMCGINGLSGHWGREKCFGIDDTRADIIQRLFFPPLMLHHLLDFFGHFHAQE